MSGIKSIAQDPDGNRGADHPRYKTYLVHGMVTYRVTYRYPGDGEHEAQSRKVTGPSTDIGQLQMMLTDPQRGIPIILAMHVGEDQLDQVEQAPPATAVPLHDYSVLLDWVDSDDEGYLVTVGAANAVVARDEAGRVATQHAGAARAAGTELVVAAVFRGDLRSALVDEGRTVL